MTNLEALKSQSVILENIPDGALEFQLSEQQLLGNDNYVPENRKAIDLAFAGLLLFIATQATSIRELDWAITNASVADLLKIRSGLLAKWGVEDEMATSPTIRAVRMW